MQRQRTQQIGFLAAFALTAGASMVSTSWSIGSPLKPWAYPYFWLPVLFATIPLRWPKRAPLAIGLLTAYVFSPLSLSIGILFVPAALTLAFALYLGRPGGSYPRLPPTLLRK
jgi:hypothetical protein